ncbi:phosphopantetheine adenylyltransferase [Clostridia bacterium]|nr:phosphopantetheine adenylyltransferase [Clostridia bacterium]
MKRAIYPGSFDPITLGHLDLIERSCAIFDEVIVGVLHNRAKKPLFTAAERMEMIREVTKNFPTVKVVAFDGLLVDFVKKCEARVVIRGLRAITDLEYEMQLAQTNRVLSSEIDTIFLTTNLAYAYLSSTTVKEVARLGGNIQAFVPEIVEKRLKDVYQV